VAAPLAPGAAVAISSGVDLPVWCAVTVEGDVLCWGDNEAGNLGNGDTTSSSTPVKVVGLPGPASAVSVGTWSVCALTRAGGVYCWGNGPDGELGNGTTPRAQSTAVPVTGLSSGAVEVSVGQGTACARKNDGTVQCWGASGLGLLGNADAPTYALTPVVVSGVTGATSLSVGANVACAVQGGQVYCWGGLDGMGELGTGALEGSDTPVAVAGLPPGMTKVAAGEDWVCAIAQSGGAFCWGDGTAGNLGNNQLAVSPTPVVVQGLMGAVDLASGGDCTCALLADGAVQCWGYGNNGELGGGVTTFGPGNDFYENPLPAPVKGLAGRVTALSGGSAPCVVLATGGVECWGVTGEIALVPVDVTGLGSGATAIALGGASNTSGFACAVDAAGAVECWGGNNVGQLGNGLETLTTQPVQNLEVTSSATAVAGGLSGDFACAVDSGLVMCWGANTYGQLGNGTTQSSSFAVAVTGISQVTSVTAGPAFACAVTQSNDLYCWGHNTFGELGNGTLSDSTTPVLAATGAGTVVSVAAGVDFACAALKDGTASCWGNNQSGDLGNGTTTISPSPVPVSGLTGVTAIAAGYYAACAVASGAVYCWGDNSEGLLGSDTLMGSTTPVEVPGLGSGATAVAVGVMNACAVVSGGVQCWGTPEARGEGTLLLDSFMPTPVSGIGSGATAVALGYISACALVNGGVQCWGANFSGQLGNGGAPNALVATAVPGFP
jgi:alpha-tubulin suppressor-like RCC1 family protein